MTVPPISTSDSKSLLSRLPALVFEFHVHHTEGNFSLNYSNQEVSQFLGFDPASFKSSGGAPNEYSDWFDPGDMEWLKARLLGGDPSHPRAFHEQCRIGRPDTRVRWLDIRMEPERLAGNDVLWRGVATDITMVKEAEEGLRLERERLALVTRAAGVGIWEYDFARDEYVFDARMRELMPIDEIGFLKGGQPGSFKVPEGGWEGTIPSEDIVRLRAERQKVLETGGLAISYEFRVRDKSGAERRLAAILDVVRHRDGTPARLIGACIEITRQTAPAVDPAGGDAGWTLALHALGEAVIATDADCRVTFMNAAAEEMTEWPRDAALGQPLERVVNLLDEAGNALADAVSACLGTMQPWHRDRAAVLVAPSGRRRTIEDSAVPVRARTGDATGAVLVIQDVTASRDLQRKLEHLAAHDALTGLPNRLSFEQRLQEACDQARREEREHVLCFMDLDRFKIVNDSAGHAAGDAFLRQIGELVRAQAREQDFTARLGGDEFALLLYDCSLQRGEFTARQLIESIRAFRLIWDGKIYDIGASIGITTISSGSSGPAELMSQADVACHAAKAGGRNQVVVYGARGGAAQRHHQEILVASGIRSAIEGNRLQLFAQEIIALNEPLGDGFNVEVLLRMKDTTGRLLTPGSFIPAAERYDLMGSLDRWVIDAVLIERGDALAAVENLSISLNLSANSLNDPLFWPFLDQVLHASSLPPTRVNFEITETALINNLATAGNFMSRVRALGYGLILDDFGTGLSSFTYLKQFAVDGLKIDGSFIRHVKDSPVDRAIVESINEIGHKLGARTIAEFVEDTETLEIVRAIGIDQAQGYVIGRPIPLELLVKAGGLRQKKLP